MWKLWKRRLLVANLAWAKTDVGTSNRIGDSPESSLQPQGKPIRFSGDTCSSLDQSLWPVWLPELRQLWLQLLHAWSWGRALSEAPEERRLMKCAGDQPTATVLHNRDSQQEEEGLPSVHGTGYPPGLGLGSFHLSALTQLFLLCASSHIFQGPKTL
jgi:hypothetical protein